MAAAREGARGEPARWRVNTTDTLVNNDNICASLMLCCKSLSPELSCTRRSTALSLTCTVFLPCNGYCVLDKWDMTHDSSYRYTQ